MSSVNLLCVFLPFRKGIILPWYQQPCITHTSKINTTTAARNAICRFIHINSMLAIYGNSCANWGRMTLTQAHLKHIWPGHTEHISNITRNHNCSIFNRTKTLAVHRAHTQHIRTLHQTIESYETEFSNVLWILNRRSYYVTAQRTLEFIGKINCREVIFKFYTIAVLWHTDMHTKRAHHEQNPISYAFWFHIFMDYLFCPINHITIFLDKQKNCAVLPYVIWLYVELEWMMNFLVSRIVIDVF